MTGRQLVCACEDVTVADVEQAIDAGHADMESLKRFTGLATGICQGRSCMATAAVMLAQRGLPKASLRPTTPRPPLWPVRLGKLAEATEPLPPIFPGPAAPILQAPLPAASPPIAHSPLPRQASTVIIGGGIMGVATAYHLARLGMRGIVVLERAYLNAGASGRNGGGMRLQWSTAQNIELMQESMRLCRGLAQELNINIWLRQGGYLFAARRSAEVETLQRNIVLQNSLGVRSRFLTAQECAQRAPGLRTDDLQGGAFNPDDGVIFPWPFIWGYADRARARGVHVAPFTPVTDFDIQSGRVRAVLTPRGPIACDLVINAAAAWSPEVAKLAGVTLPSHPQRHEIMVTESLKPFLNPLVVEVGSGLYFSQSMRGEIVAGMGEAEQPPGLEMRSSLRFSLRIAGALCRRFPALAGVQQVRQWAGCYDVTPDGNPLIGEKSGLSGFFQLNGFVGHGFMMAPAVSRRVAYHLAKGQANSIFEVFHPDRFNKPQRTAAETMIIG